MFIDKTAEILSWMKSKSKEELKAIWKCNDKIVEQNFNRLENMDLYNRLAPAVLAYEGIAFQFAIILPLFSELTCANIIIDK